MMATKLQQIETQADVVEKTGAKPLESIVDQVRRDSTDQSDKYLDETEVPHGGE